MDKVYVVSLSAGSYSDYSHTNICAFLDRDQAEAFAEEKNEQLVRCNKAKSELYKHMTAWNNNNPLPRQSDHDKKREDDISRTKKKDRTQKQIDDLAEIEARSEARRIIYMGHGRTYKNEQVEFINSRDYLTNEDKADLNDGMGQFQTDGSYDVEEIELK